MTTPRFFVPLFAALAAAAFAPAFAATDPAKPEGLAAISSRTLDEVYLRPGIDLSTYRKVMVDPARVETAKGWRKSINEQREPSRWITVADEQDMVSTAAVGMSKAVADGFRERGYEVVTAAGPGVLRVAPSTADLFVNAPDTVTPTLQHQITAKEAGDATLVMDVRDSVNGTLVARVVDRNTSRQVGRFNNVSLISNQFWFDAMYSEWARNCASEFAARGAP